mgnify:CR=1 FL=1
MPCLHLSLTGRVQGVGLRWAVRRYCQQAGLAGWVKNERTGAVSMLVAGNQAELDRLLAWLKQSPAAIRVDNIICEPTTVEVKPGFFIKHSWTWL